MGKLEQTEPLPNGAELPTHPANTTSLKITEFLTVRDAEDGTRLIRGMHGNELGMLMMGNQMALGHLYRYMIRDNRIFHTRRLVTIDCECEENPL